MGQLTKKECLEKELIFKKSLSPTKKRILRKLWPFRRDRNRLICALARRGVSQWLLSRVSGLGPLQIFRIIRQGKQPRKEERR